MEASGTTHSLQNPRKGLHQKTSYQHRAVNAARRVTVCSSPVVLVTADDYSIT